MDRPPRFRCLFVDIGGVLLSDGWNRHARQRAASHFGLDHPEMEDRHHMVVETFEAGKISLDDYLAHVVFNKSREFEPSDFREFMFAQSVAIPGMIELVDQLKRTHHLKIVVVSNEGRELNAYRIAKFGLTSFVDAFICSSLVHLRKPDTDIYRLALDVAQVPASQVLYLENTAMFINVAEGLGIPSILHVDCESTRWQFAAMGLGDTEAGSTKVSEDIVELLMEEDGLPVIL